MTNALIEAIAIALHVDSGYLPPATPASLEPVTVPPAPIPREPSADELDAAERRLAVKWQSTRATVRARGRNA